MKKRVITATEFKAKCLALLDEINDRGSEITITKRGRPLARVTPAPKRPWKSPEGAWVGKVWIAGDIVNDDAADSWEVLRED